MSRMDFRFDIDALTAPACAPEVSVVMPVYNAAATLRATIDSVLAQSFPWFELIAIDDGSRDNSLDLLLDLAARDPRLKVVSRPNGGVSSARNMGVEMASAPLIAFLDADDLWAPTKLAHHVALHREDPQLASSYARIAFIDADAGSLEGAQTHSSLCPHSPRLIDVLGENPMCTASNFVVRRDWFCAMGGFDEKLGHAEDQEFAARLIHGGGRMEGVDAVLTGYRFSPCGLSMELERMHAGWRSVASRYLADDQFAALEAVYCRYLARRVLRGGGSAMRSLHYIATGLRLDARSFFAQRRRAAATLVGAVAALVLPRGVRLRVFA